MIRTCTCLQDGTIKYDVPLRAVKDKNVKWYWVDFSNPNNNEAKQLSKVFHFHPLAIEDCLDGFSQRPKIDFYDQYFFIVLHALNVSSLDPYEVDLFINEKYIVTVHKKPVRELNNLWDQLKKKDSASQSPFSIMHAIVDKLVDDFFPPVYQIEDRLNVIEDNTEEETINELMDKLFDIRHEMSKLRRSLLPMRDLLYRILHSDRMSFLKDQQLYFQDVYDHLIKLVEMLESYREFSADVRDSYLSINSDKMNNIMMTLTVITTIFMPLTFIAGLYGMNFQYMPELRWKYSYFVVLGIMFLIAAMMFMMFVKIGWLRFGRRKKKKKRLIKIK
ncbi:magnesium/cobalt transporter CorA [Falsibacillus albus]|uniref:Magnesium transport protein CorA n=1 Tax=Falsibacillus albus TaxID=2478915 RepID=A0A3L7K485_9BACI|nr:magnesium/cobalt transporter CorA [Falsibacillus albus]RLQ97079.1 magnesium and cobalt transport protein CorA [Falsibacillus albus]